MRYISTTDPLTLYSLLFRNSERYVSIEQVQSFWTDFIAVLMFLSLVFHSILFILFPKFIWTWLSLIKLLQQSQRIAKDYYNNIIILYYYNLLLSRRSIILQHYIIIIIIIL